MYAIIAAFSAIITGLGAQLHQHPGGHPGPATNPAHH